MADVPQYLRRPPEPDLSVRPEAAEPVVRAEALRRRAEPEDPRRWTGGDTALQAAFAATMLGDYLQTRRIVRAGREVNPLIGQRGQRIPPAVYFPATFLLHTAAMRALPQPWRRVAQGLSIGFEGGVVGRNTALGFRF